MYFKEKDDTNIDSEFESKKKIGFNFDFSFFNSKPKLFIIGGIVLLLLLVVVFVIIALSNGKEKYRLELFGSDNVVMLLGEDYIEPGYKAFDKKNNDITSEVDITNNVNFSKAGEYEIIYSIGDVEKVRYVSIIEGNKETYIYLLGDSEINLKVGEKYTDPGYNVYDSVDADLKSKVKVTGTVDTSKKGTYIITYSVTNSRNVTTIAKRIVVVK